MTLTILGSGDAVASGGRFHTCFHLQAGDHEILIDCGGSGIVSLQRAGIATDRIRAILLSHLHGDHFGGLPFFFIDAKYVAKRRRPLTIAGPPGLEARVTQTTDLMFPGVLASGLPFPVEYLELQPGRPAAVGTVAVLAAEVVHPSGAPSYALRVTGGGRTMAYSGDTEWTDALIEVARGAHLFVCECYAFDEPVPGHLSYETLAGRRADLACDRLLLTHMNAAMLQHVALRDLAIETAFDGMRIEV
jgi:ribonuclease BN (tRNA processing enzyme)